jgi:hypothetical protein
LTKYFKVNAIKVAYLEKLRDIDSLHDIKKLFNSFKTVYGNLFQLFLIIFSKIKKTIYEIEVSPVFLFQSNFGNKGSPYLF